MRARYSKFPNVSGRRSARFPRRFRRQFNLEALEPRNLLAADDCGCGFADTQLASELSLPAHVTVASSDTSFAEQLTPTGTGFTAVRGEPVLNEASDKVSAGQAASDLHQVDVAHLGGTPSGPLGAYVVSVVGTGIQGQMASWKLTDDAPAPAHLGDSNPFVGSDLALTVLYPADDPELARRPFLLSRIARDGSLWLDSYHLTIAGGFVNDDMRGYGANAGVTVLEHAIAQRPADDNDDSALVVTPIIGDSGNGPELRVITWRVDVNTQAVSGLMDSGPLKVEKLPAAGSELSIFHQTAGVFVVNYVAPSGEVVSQYVGVGDGGQVVNMGAGESGKDFDGTAFSLDGNQVAAGPLGPTSYVAAVEENGKVVLTTWERRIEGCFFLLCSFEPFMVGHSDDDGNPVQKGVAIPEPELGHAYEITGDDGDNFGSAIAIGDFNGDGYDDVAVGAPGEEVDGAASAGAVTVLYGSKNGLYNSAHNWTFSQATVGIQGAAQEGDRFGFSLAAGDFNGDGRDDLAIGVPGEAIEADNLEQVGVVQVVYGSANGLTASGNQLFQQGESGLLGVSEANDQFGWALAAGDFNNDGRDDLAVGNPFEDHDGGGLTDAGAIHLIYGTATGLATGANEVVHQDTANVLGTAASGDQFGYALTVGDFNGDNFPDLAVGVPGEDFFGFNDAGAVQVFRGGATGITTNDQIISQDGVVSNSNDLVGDISDGTETGDRFGQSLAAGNFNGDDFDDLAVGAPEEDLDPVEGINHGRVHVLYGSASGITPTGEQVWDQTSTGILTDPEPGSRFGYALGAGDIHNNGIDDLLVGVPFQDSDAGGNVTYANSGVAILLRGTATGLTGFASPKLEQGINNISDDAAPGDLFGHVVAFGDFDANGYDDAVIGVPSELVSFFGDRPNAGAIQVVYSDFGGFTDNDRVWAQGVTRHIRVMLSDSDWEVEFGIAGGTIYEVMPQNEPVAVHAASVTKTLTLLLAVEALEAGLVSLDDPVEIGELAAGTGGSQMEPLLEQGDIVLLETLLYGMMIPSGNTASVAIGQHIAVNALGAPANDEQAAFDVFVAEMNERLDDLLMNDSQAGHPAGGMVTTPQDLITLFREGWRHSLFQKFAGAHISHQGQSLNGDPPKQWDLVRNSTYIGHDGYKGGHGRVGSVYDDQGNLIVVPIGLQTHVGQASRADHSLIVGIQQSNDDHANANKLYDYGFKRLFTPDRRGHNDFTSGGPIIIGPGPQMGDVIDFAIDHVTGNWSVSAAIDGDGHLQLITWDAQVTPGTVVALGGAIQTYTSLGSGQQTEVGTTVDIVPLPTSGPIVGDYLTGSIASGKLRLDVWRLGAEPTAPFSFLPGDFSGDLRVDTADYVLYRKTLGSRTDLRADGNGNGIVDAADYGIWRANFGRVQASRTVGSGQSQIETVPAPSAHSASLLTVTHDNSKQFSTPTTMSWVGGDGDSWESSTVQFKMADEPADASFVATAINSGISNQAREWSPTTKNSGRTMRLPTEWIQSLHANANILVRNAGPKLADSIANFGQTFADSHEKRISTDALDAVFAELASENDGDFSDGSLCWNLNTLPGLNAWNDKMSKS